MKKLLFIIIGFILLSSCGVNYKYKIEGYVKSPKDFDKYKGYHSAIVYTDTFYFNKDSVWFFNSDGSKMTIHRPYTIKKIQTSPSPSNKNDDDDDLMWFIILTNY